MLLEQRDIASIAVNRMANVDVLRATSVGNHEKRLRGMIPDLPRPLPRRDVGRAQGRKGYRRGRGIG